MKKSSQDKKKETKETALLNEFVHAAFDDHPKAKAMLAAHPELKNAHRMGETLLHWLAVEGHSEAVDFLAGLGFDVNTASKFGNTPLIDAADLGHEKTVAVLLARGADPNANSLTTDTALACALRSGHVRVVKMLLDAGAKLDYVTDIQETWRDHLPRIEERRKEILALLANYNAAL